MMRLAQVRDWVAGQAFNDWTQYRLAPPQGGAMHWSRINDVGPALIILLLDPVVGRYGAELAAVLVYPALLFITYLFLSARMARRLGDASGAVVAMVVAAIAYPANALFLPGRIDHHGLQIVLVQIAILTLMRPGGWRSGAILGGIIAISFGIGLETAPHAGALMGVLFVAWLLRGELERNRMLAAGAALAGVTLISFAFARPTYWTTVWCDAFTPASVAAALAGGAFWIIAALRRRICRDPVKARGRCGARRRRRRRADRSFPRLSRRALWRYGPIRRPRDDRQYPRSAKPVRTTLAGLGARRGGAARHGDHRRRVDRLAPPRGPVGAAAHRRGAADMRVLTLSQVRGAYLGARSPRRCSLN